MNEKFGIKISRLARIAVRNCEQLKLNNADSSNAIGTKKTN